MEHSFWYNYYYKDLQNAQNLAKEIKEKTERLNGFFKELDALKTSWKKFVSNGTEQSFVLNQGLKFQNFSQEFFLFH